MEMHQAVHEHQVVTHIPATDLESKVVPDASDWAEFDGDVVPLADFMDANGSIENDSLLDLSLDAYKEPQPLVERIRPPQPWDNDRSPTEDASPSNVIGTIRRQEHEKAAREDAALAEQALEFELLMRLKCRKIADGIHDAHLQSRIDAVNADTTLSETAKSREISRIYAKEQARIQKFGKRA